MNWMNAKGWGKRVLIVIGALIFAALVALLFGWLLMLLWNWLMPSIFGLPSITYWQGWGLILLSHLLFKGGHGGPHGGHGHPRHRGFHGKKGCRGGHDQEGFDEFKREFRHRMRQRWHENESMPDRAEEGEEKSSED